MSITIPDQYEIHRLAKEKGWYDGIDTNNLRFLPPDFIPAKLALIHSELSEALEAYRKNGIPNVDGQDFASILYDAITTNGHGHTFIMLTKRADRMLDYFSSGRESMLRRWEKAGDGWLHVGDGDELFSEYAEGQTIPQPDHEDYPNRLHK